MNQKEIPESTQRAMTEFFMKTSVPRILKAEEYKEKDKNAPDEINHPDEYEKLSQEEKVKLIAWIKSNLDPIKSFNNQKTSYGIKHKFSNSQEGFYITNGAFKGAMLECGYKVKDKSARNWVFNVSKRSKAFQGASYE